LNGFDQDFEPPGLGACPTIDGCFSASEQLFNLRIDDGPDMLGHTGLQVIDGTARKKSFRAVIEGERA
jgi:hypothetical protein